MPLNPYHFVSAPPECAVSGDPQYHDVLNTEQRWSGELRCDLTALTPLLAANDQYVFGDANTDVQSAFRQLVTARASGKIDADKTILEPLMPTGATGPVVIGGPALKGAIRSAWGSLLAAPMERVAERTFSYRPNARLTARDNLLETCVGVVSHRNGDGLEIVPLAELPDIVYMTDPAVTSLFRGWRITETSYLDRLAVLQSSDGTFPFATRTAPLRPLNVTIADCEFREQRGCVKAIRVPRQSVTISRSYLLPYRAGLDGRGAFNASFHNNESRRGYRYVLAVLPDEPELLHIDASLVTHWRETLHHLHDRDQGHLVAHPTLRARTDEARTSLSQLIDDGWRPGDVLFFERELSGQRRVRTIGHHFRYCWRYRDTIRTSNTHSRPELVATDAERKDVPSRLTAARLLFGYVATGDQEAESLGIGKNDFAMFAGRIAFNHAVERDLKRTGRFCNEEHACLVPLWPLGSPKPSAVEHYLTQDGIDDRTDAGTLQTWGDDEKDTCAGSLRGRKAYLHQPDAAHQPNVYEIVAPVQAEIEFLTGNQAAVARFVSKPGTRFGFTIRFVDLKDWELGGLLFTLSPRADDLRPFLDGLTDAEASKALRDVLKKIDDEVCAHQEQPGLAHKIGHGRPLGMGSVTVEVKECRRVRMNHDSGATLADVDLKSTRATLIDAFRAEVRRQLGTEFGRWVREVLVRWLKVRRYAGRTWCDYPRLKGTIHGYHTALRGEHILGRKSQKKSGTIQPRCLQEPD